MSDSLTLDHYLAEWAEGKPRRQDVANTVKAISDACIKISHLLRAGDLELPLGATTGKRIGVDMQKQIDVITSDILIEALQSAPVASVASEERDDAVVLDSGKSLCVAIDPIDGSSNTNIAAPVGTIFSILPFNKESSGYDVNLPFLRRGVDQLAAGFFVYGPQTVLVLTVGAGTDCFTLNPSDGVLKRTDRHLTIPPTAAEFAINASNYRHWDQPIRSYFIDCNRGRTGPREKDFNMRWTACPAVEIYRILKRGGIFLYPGDLRPGYKDGRLRIIYEANPLAFIIEQASGAASTGHERIMEVEPTALHQHIPVVAGSREEVSYVTRLHREPIADGERSPLFRRRGLFRP